MTENDQSQPSNLEGDDPQELPSQAEGDRDTVEQDLRQRSGQGGEPVAGGGDVRSTPSQAEGDREMIERDIEEQSKKQR